MATQKFIYDAGGNVIREVITQDLDGKDTFHVRTRVNADPIIRANRISEENHKQGGHRKLAARVPITVYEKAVREGWANDQAAWRKFLNDPDNRAWRVWQGRL